MNPEYWLAENNRSLMELALTAAEALADFSNYVFDSSK